MSLLCFSNVLAEAGRIKVKCDQFQKSASVENNTGNIQLNKQLRKGQQASACVYDSKIDVNSCYVPDIVKDLRGIDKEVDILSRAVSMV